MQESTSFHYNLEWPAPDPTVCGPVVWLRGWIVGKAGHDFVDLRVCTGTQIHLGLLGLPRVDLAAHFKASRPWLPAEFVVGVPLPDGPAELRLEALDAWGAWHTLQTLSLTVGPDGAPNPRAEGVLIERPGGSWTLRDAHLPFHGHLDEPADPVALNCGRAEIFGWLLHEAQPLKAVLATTDLLVFNHLAHSLTDTTLATKIDRPQAAHARLKGEVDVPPTLTHPACLRVYAELGDGSVQLCFVQRLGLPSVAVPAVAPPNFEDRLPAAAHRILADLPSGRPRRLLLSTLNLLADDATLRALDIGRQLVATNRWAARLVTTVDGPLRREFEAAGIDVQVVDPLPLFSAQDTAAVELAVSDLGRQIWWRQLDGVAVFDPLCFWAITLGRSQQLPVLFDCSVDRDLAPPSDVSAALGAAMLAGWKSASLVCYASVAGARLQAAQLGTLPMELVPHWSESSPVAAASAHEFAVAPIGGSAVQGAAVLLRAADWLSRRQADFPWRIAISDVRGGASEMPFVQDAVLNRPAMMAIEPRAVTTAAACVCPAFSGHPIRALLNAAAAGVPIITTPSPTLSEIFSPREAAIVPAGNPLALAHALMDLVANPTAATRRAEQARARVLAHHSAAPALARWQAALESMVAAGGIR